MNKAEQEANDKHEAWEKEQAKTGHVTLPRSGEPGSPDHPDFPKVTSTAPKPKGK